MSEARRSGECLCGSVKFEVTLAEPHIHVCHCNLCRKWSGGPSLSITCKNDWTITGEENVTWYDSSDWGQRGFCKKCGTHLFGRVGGGDYRGVHAGSLDDTSGLSIDKHIFIDKKPSYYDFAGDAETLTEEQFYALFAEVEE